MRIATPREILSESVVKSGKRYWNASSQAVIVDAGAMVLDMPLVVSGKCQYLEWRADATGAQLEIDGIECVRIVDAASDQASGLTEAQKIEQVERLINGQKAGGWRCLVLRNFQSAYIESTSFGQATDLNNVHIGPGKRLHVRDFRFSNKSHYDTSEGTPRWIGGGPIVDGVDEVLWECGGPHDVDMRIPDVARCKVFVSLNSYFTSRTNTPNVLTDVERFSAIRCEWPIKHPWGGGFIARGKRPIVDILHGNVINEVPVIAVDDKASGYPAILPGPESGGVAALPAWMRRRVEAAI